MCKFISGGVTIIIVDGLRVRRRKKLQKSEDSGGPGSLIYNFFVGTNDTHNTECTPLPFEVRILEASSGATSLFLCYFFFIQGWRRFPTVSTPAFARMRSETDEAKEQRSGGVGFRFQLWVVFGAVTGKCFCGMRLSRRYRYVPYSKTIELHHTSVYLDRGKELHNARNSRPNKSTALDCSFFFFFSYILFIVVMTDWIICSHFDISEIYVLVGCCAQAGQLGRS